MNTMLFKFNIHFKAVLLHAMKALGGRGGIAPTHSWPRHYMWMSGQRRAPAALLPPGKGPPVPTGQKAGWAPDPVWTQRLEEKLFASARDLCLRLHVYNQILLKVRWLQLIIEGTVFLWFVVPRVCWVCHVWGSKESLCVWFWERERVTRSVLHITEWWKIRRITWVQ
jgi:hypothetical protein